MIPLSITEDRLRPHPVLPREKWWWLALGLLMLLAGWLYIRGYDTSLPFIEHVDEPNHLLSAQHLIDEGSARNPLWYDAYPPGMYRLHYILIKHIKPPELRFTAVLPMARLITIAVWMLSFALIALIGRQMAHPLTGLMAAGFYLVNHWVVERGRYALPDGYLTLFTLLALWLALVSVRQGRRSFSTASVYSIMMAIVFKTQAIFIAPFVVLMPLLGLRNRADFDVRRGAWRQTFWNCVRFGFFLFWLLFIYRTLEVDNVPEWVAPSHSFGNSLFANIQTHLLLTARALGPDAGWLLAAICGIALWRYRRETSPVAIFAILLSAFALLIGSSLFGRQSLRQFFTLGAFLSLLYALGLTGVYHLLQEALTRLPPHFQLFLRFRTLLPAGLVAALFAISLLPAYRESDALAHNYSLPDRRNDLAHYGDISLPPGKYISNHDNHKTFNRAWGGYDGVHDFPIAQKMKDIMDEPLETWRELGAEYAIMPWTDEPDAYYPDETVRLKNYPPDPNFRGPSMVVLRLYPMQHEASGQLGGIRLVGYDINASAFQPGDEIVFRHYWLAEAPTATPQHVFNHLLETLKRSCWGASSR